MPNATITSEAKVPQLVERRTDFQMGGKPLSTKYVDSSSESDDEIFHPVNRGKSKRPDPIPKSQSCNQLDFIGENSSEGQPTSSLRKLPSFRGFNFSAPEDEGEDL
jgi:hypothetical protein